MAHFVPHYVYMHTHITSKLSTVQEVEGRSDTRAKQHVYVVPPPSFYVFLNKVLLETQERFISSACSHIHTHLLQLYLNSSMLLPQIRNRSTKEAEKQLERLGAATDAIHSFWWNGLSLHSEEKLQITLFDPFNL